MLNLFGCLHGNELVDKYAKQALRSELVLPKMNPRETVAEAIIIKKKKKFQKV